MANTEKKLLTREGLQKYESELDYLKHEKMKEISQKIKEAREQGDLSENAEYDAAKDEQRDVAARIEQLEELLKNVEVVDVDTSSSKITKVAFGCTVTIIDIEQDDEFDFTIKGASEADSLNGIISNESPIGKVLIGAKKGEVIEVEAPDGVVKYKIKDIRMD